MLLSIKWDLETNRIFRAVLYLLPILACTSEVALADGMVFDLLSFQDLQQREQRAAIFHKDGRQSMVIALDMEVYQGEGESEDRESLWIFPVPGAPKDVKLDLVDKFPIFVRDYFMLMARKRPMTLLGGPVVTNIISVPLILPYFLSYRRGYIRPFEEIDRWGIHAETVAVQSLENLADHIRKRGLSVEMSRLESFRQYCSSEFTLVLAWIDSRQEMQKHFSKYQKSRYPIGKRPCVYVEFPSKKGFYPLIPTSGYGKKSVRVLLYIVGHVTTNIKDIRNKIELTTTRNFDAGF